jgi:hypothetical protein
MIGGMAGADHRCARGPGGTISRLAFGVRHGSFTEGFGRHGIIHSEALRHGAPLTRHPGSGAVFQPPAVIAGLDDVAMMRQTVEQRRRHLGVAKNTRPFHRMRDWSSRSPMSAHIAG